MPEPSQLEARIAVLEAAIAELSQELVTRRVSIVDDDGVARVVLCAELRTGSVLARLDRPDGRTSGIELFASEPEGEPAILGLGQVSAGEAVLLIECDELQEARTQPKGEAPYAADPSR